MGKYDFDKVIERRGTDSVKYDCGMKYAGRDDLLPMWVADMDFRAPDEVIEALKNRADHGIFGYTEYGGDYIEAVQSWFRRHHGWEPEKNWNTITPGVVYAISLAVRTFTEPGDAVIIQEPVYYPFRSVIEKNGRVCVNSPLVEGNSAGSRWQMDFDGFEIAVKENDVKMYILCNPHNPVGRVWEEPELRRIADICIENGVMVVSDEIHCDFIYPGNTFTSYARLGEKYLDNTVICTSPSKTFNLAGLQIANIFIPDKSLRHAYRKANSAAGFGEGNTLGLEAAKAAYRYGDEWLSELMIYLKGNLEFMKSYVADNIPGVRVIEPEGTYLVWTDFSGVADTEEELLEIVRDGARLWLDEGSMFAKDTYLFERFNIACPRSVLETALDRLKDAVAKHLEKKKGE